MRYLSSCLIIALGLLGPNALWSETRLKGFTELGGQAGAIFFEGDSHLDEDGMYGGRLGYYIEDWFSLEASVLVGETEIDNTTKDASLILPTLEGLFVCSHLDHLQPFLSIGAGALDINRENASDSTHAVVPMGGGVKWIFNNYLLARLDARYLIDLDSGRGTHNALVTGGLSLLFGEAGEPKKESVPEPKVVDLDGDGVLDNADQCPGTPKGKQVDSKGCEIKEVKAVDTDGDGVMDDADKCPGTPKGAAVDANGCPLDSDKDGVYDYQDKCPGTPAGTTVGTDGCKPPKEVKIQLDIKFDSGKADVKPEYESQVQKVVDFMKTYPTTSAQIGGHTDNMGAREFNVSLSQQRADSVRNAIIQKGIAANRISAKGYGPDKPIADNTSREGRAKNRRVVATLTAMEK